MRFAVSRVAAHESARMRLSDPTVPLNVRSKCLFSQAPNPPVLLLPHRHSLCWEFPPRSRANRSHECTLDILRRSLDDFTSLDLQFLHGLSPPSAR